eukprot:m.313773 g.313773  ORF g.313773 m.313773 type:complete len:61 (+) comp436176_c0_seq1:103-285(+)
MSQGVPMPATAKELVTGEEQIVRMKAPQHSVDNTQQISAASQEHLLALPFPLLPSTVLQN